MPVLATTPRPGQGLPRRRGIVSGYVWKLIRESVKMTQAQLAVELAVDVATIQAWESGRRPLTAVSAGELARFRGHLLRRGVRPRLFSVLNDAVEADVLIDHAVTYGEDTASVLHHPLAVTVHQRDLTNLITWPLTGIMPTQLAGLVLPAAGRRGPVASHPELGVQERSRLFEHLLVTLDAHPADNRQLLRRQAVYLLAFDDNPDTKQRLADHHKQAMRTLRRINDISSWVSMRSAAVALAHAGDPEPLSMFIASALSDQHQELANLNYWAYWVGETADIHTDDDFMHHADLPWDGTRLLDHLTSRLYPSTSQVELYVHTVSQLLLARPRLVDRRPELKTRALARLHQALDQADIPAGARQQLSNVAYAIKLSDR
jgi:transcriptional regulator with XRE-family HTH domain